ncbi:uncharacterized protein PV06_04287 [Exophiala oligosperma]|uniref:Uncharacterized protein n=1 Tax=Exophiala oligosperma TaxID=215243 RepID=A0A0D2C0B3_9EURO|nr:uncharacterized protein PV06_04287 [Exophiala oligosperma]KIW43152.1 hypothetical protein PV06_04287 [Exophiala oligosperma]
MRFNLAEESFAMQASPSKARAEALESHSWSLVLEWLSKLYHPSPIPAFERNSFTLQALQSLMGENIAAERLRDLVYEAQIEELFTTTTTTTTNEKDKDKDTLSAQNDSTNTTTTTTKDPRNLLYRIRSSLSKPSRTALDSISEAAVIAGCSASSSSAGGSSRQNKTILQDLQSHITSLPIQLFKLETQLESIDDLISNLQGEIEQFQKSTSSTKNKSRTRSRRKDRSTTVPSGTGGGRSISSPPQTPTTLSTMTFPNDDDDEDEDDEDDRHYTTLHAETVQHQRETKQLTIKCAEYTERIASLERQASVSSSTTTNEPTLADVAEKQVLVTQKRKRVEHLGKKILQFHSLPPDLDASRTEVRRAQAELELLKNKRDDLFAQLGSS